MGQLVFQATLGGQVNLVGPNTASTFNLDVPAVSATLATTAANTFTAVQTFSAGSAGAPAITTSGDTNTGIFFPAADTIAFSEGGTESARIDASGNFGLGVTPSAWSLFKAQEIGRVGNSFAARPDASQVDIGCNWYYASGDKYANTGAATLYEQASGVHRWYNAASGTAGNPITFTQAMTLDASGNLGIGLTSPSQKLSVGGNMAFHQSSNLTTTTGFLNIVPASTLILDTGDSIHFRISSSERARIDSSGNLLVGTTSTVGSARVAIVSSSNTSATRAVNLQNSSGTNLLIVLNDGQVYANEIGSDTGTALVLNSGGYIKKLTSSIRYKKDVEPIDIGLDFVLGLNPVKYNMKNSDTPQVGFIAEDFPDGRFVSHSMIDAQDSSKGTQIESVNYANITAPLVKAIQEQQALITSLTARLDAANL